MFDNTADIAQPRDAMDNYISFMSTALRPGSRIHLLDSPPPPEAPRRDFLRLGENIQNLGRYFKAITKTWMDLVDYIKSCLKDNDEVRNVASNRLGERVSQFLFGSKSYLRSAWDNAINYKGKSFITRKSKFMSQEKALEIYKALKSKQQVFGTSWSGVHEDFGSFWNIRFGGEFNEHINDYVEDFDYIKEELYDGVKSLFAEFLGLNRIQIHPAFITRILEPHRYLRGGFGRSGTEKIKISTISRLICEVKDLTEQKIIDSGKKRKTGPLANLKLSDIKDLPSFRSKLEDYLINFLMTKSGSAFHPFAEHKLRFDLEVFYTIYKNTPSQDRYDVSFKSIKEDLKSLAVEIDGDSYASQFGSYSISPTYHWRSLMTIVTYLRKKVHNGEISMSDYTRVVEAGRVLSKETGMNPSRPSVYTYSPSLEFKYSKSNIEALKIESNSEIYRIFDYFHKLENSGGGRALVKFFNALKGCTESFSMSLFSMSPYSKNLGFVKEDRQEYIKRVANNVVGEIGTHHKSLGELVRFAGYRNTDEFVLNDAKLLSLINPSTKYNEQPSHEFMQYLALKEIPTIIAVEPLLWTMIDGKVYNGHVDFFQVDGNKIRLIDYKPDLNFDPSSDNVAKHFIDSIPQVASYGIILNLMFGILGYEIECVTFNENGYYIYDPYKALESSVDFYYGHIGTLPDWYRLLPQDTIDKIIQKYS